MSPLGDPGGVVTNAEGGSLLSTSKVIVSSGAPVLVSIVVIRIVTPVVSAGPRSLEASQRKTWAVPPGEDVRPVRPSLAGEVHPVHSLARK